MSAKLSTLLNHFADNPWRSLGELSLLLNHVKIADSAAAAQHAVDMDAQFIF
jgi:hypothetical protein